LQRRTSRTAGSFIEWVDDLALEPKWRLAAWHTTPVDRPINVDNLVSGTSDEVTFDRFASFISRIERIVASTISPRPARAEDISAPEDDAAEREVESTMAAGDQSRRGDRRDGDSRAVGFRRGDPTAHCRREGATPRQRRSDHRSAAGNGIDADGAVLRDGTTSPGQRATGRRRDPVGRQ
jgi:hypothetical protein